MAYEYSIPPPGLRSQCGRGESTRDLSTGLYSRSMAEADGPRGKVALIGLDGATYRVLDPLIRAGVMPATARLTERAAHAILHSTIPTYTPPGWVSMATGVNPGRHGVFGFLLSTPQESAQIAHSGSIDSSPLWRHLDQMGLRSGIFNVPMSYPPRPLNGFMVSGGLAAGWTNTEMPNFASDTAMGQTILKLSDGHYPLDTVVSYENDWRDTAALSRLEQVQRLRRKVLGHLLEHSDVDLLFGVFEGPDRLQHLYYQYIVEGTGWEGRAEAAHVRDRAFDYFAELDKAIEDLVDWAGTDGHVILVSDHGFGPWEKTLNLNLLLEDWGYAKLPSIGRITRSSLVAGAGQRLARRVLPRRMLQAAKARVGRDIDWGDTRAFASHVAEQGIHINTQDELPRGILNSREATRTEEEIVDRLHSLVDPDDGEPVIDRIIRRAEVIHGPHTARAPHLFPFCRDQRYELSDTLAASGVLTDHRDRPWGYHHIDGVFIAAGPGVVRGRLSDPLEIVDVLPTMFHLAGLEVPHGLDGRVVSQVLDGEAASRPIITADRSPEQGRADDYPYSPEDEVMIEESLRGLGYLE